MKQDRRKFIKTSAVGSAGLLLSSLESLALPEMTTSTFNKNYEL